MVKKMHPFRKFSKRDTSNCQFWKCFLQGPIQISYFSQVFLIRGVSYRGSPPCINFLPIELVVIENSIYSTVCCQYIHISYMLVQKIKFTRLAFLRNVFMLEMLNVILMLFNSPGITTMELKIIKSQSSIFLVDIFLVINILVRVSYDFCDEQKICGIYIKESSS